jgi:hypothetical protein
MNMRTRSTSVSKKPLNRVLRAETIPERMGIPGSQSAYFFFVRGGSAKSWRDPSEEDQPC